MVLHVSPDLRVREAAEADLPRLIEMGRAALEAAPLDLPFSEPWLRRTFHHLMSSKFGLVLVLEHSGSSVGMLMASVGESPLSPVLLAQEIALWVDPEHRGRGLRQMLQCYEAWARIRGAAHTGLCTFHDPRTTKVFQRLGYHPIETHYVAKA